MVNRVNRDELLVQETNTSMCSGLPVSVVELQGANTPQNKANAQWRRIADSGSWIQPVEKKRRPRNSIL